MGRSPRPFIWEVAVDSLVGILLAAIIYGYWVWLRYKPRTVALCLLGVAFVGAWIFLQGYGYVRFRKGNEGGLVRAIESVQLMARGSGGAAKSSLFTAAQPSVEFTLLAIHMFTGVRPGKRWHTLLRSLQHFCQSDSPPILAAAKT